MVKIHWIIIYAHNTPDHDKRPNWSAALLPNFLTDNRHYCQLLRLKNHVESGLDAHFFIRRNPNPVCFVCNPLQMFCLSELQTFQTFIWRILNFTKFYIYKIKGGFGWVLLLSASETRDVLKLINDFKCTLPPFP